MTASRPESSNFPGLIWSQIAWEREQANFFYINYHYQDYSDTRTHFSHERAKSRVFTLCVDLDRVLVIYKSFRDNPPLPNLQDFR